MSYTYNLSVSSNTINGYTGTLNGGHLDLSGHPDLSGITVTAIKNLAFINNTSITTVTFRNTITSIGTYAFSGCTGLTSLSLPPNMSSIGAGAFSGCVNLSGNLILPSGITSIEGELFKNCSNLTGSLTIPNTVTIIQGLAFFGCSGLTSPLTIPSSVVTIGRNAFQNCTGFTGALYLSSNTRDIVSAGRITNPPQEIRNDWDPFLNTGFTSIIFGWNVWGRPLQAATFNNLSYTATIDGQRIWGTIPGTPVCFLGSAPVLTPSGYRRIDSLRAGDMVQTADGRAVAIQRVKKMTAQPGPTADPFVIPVGRFGATAALPISPRHRVAVPGRGLIEAQYIEGLTRLPMSAPWTYYNLGLPNWETDNLVVGGVEVESLAPVERIKMTMAEFVAILTKKYGAEASSKAVIDRVLANCRMSSDGLVEAPVIRSRQ